MSEVESKTAGVIETSQNENPSLLKRARGVLDNSAFGKFIGGAMLISALTGVTKKAVADTVACITIDGDGGGNYLVTDKIGCSENDNTIGPNNGESTLQSEPPLVFNDRLLAHSYHFDSNPKNSYKEFDPQLNPQPAQVSWPGNTINQIVGKDNAIGIGGGYFYRLNGNTFELMGTGAASINQNNNKAFGGYVFVRALTVSVSPQKYMIDIFKETDIINGGADGNNENRISPIKEWQIGTDADGGIISSGNGLAIDEVAGSILTGVNTVNGDGYIEIPFGNSLQNGVFTDTNFAQDNPQTGFQETGFPISEIYIDSTGARFFKSNTGDLYVEIENQNVKDYTKITGVGNIKSITVLPSGGLYIIEEEARIPKILKADGSLTPSLSQDFPGNGNLGEIVGCNAIDPNWIYEGVDPNDDNVCTVDTVDPVNDIPVNTPDTSKNGDTCDDKYSSTENDQCKDGVCAGTLIVSPDATEPDEGVVVEDTQDVIEPDEGVAVEDTQDVIEPDEGVAVEDTQDVIEPPDDIIGDEAGTDAVDAIDPTDTIPENDYRPEIKELPEDVTEENDYRGEDVIQDASTEDTVNIDADNPDIVTEGGKGGGGCSSVPNGVNDTRTGVAAVMLAALAALSGSRWRRREEEVKLNK